MKPTVNLVWYKRDLRVCDHLPLSRAAESGIPVLPIYVVEPDYWQQPFASRRHWCFIRDCLLDLRQETTELGQPLVVSVGDVCQVFDQLQQHYSTREIFTHQECSNGWTFKRDKAVAAWCTNNKITLHEFPHNGIVRGLKSRDEWSKLRNKRMAQPVVEPPRQLQALEGYPIGEIPSATDPMFGDALEGVVQPGGRIAALQTLDSFLHTRSVNYLFNISKPGNSEYYCSRLSAHFTWGSLSVREVVKATKTFRESDNFGQKGPQKRSFAAFNSRLSWRCHFMQKLEDQPDIEFKCMHSAYEGIREDNNQAFYDAWAEGRTGYPIIDACMRSLINSGWITFRMRAMLVSFASYHLWLDWRKTGYHLARLFTDYEPGIHYSQLQMQSGVTGINTVRIYNPIKQSQDQDPNGHFIRKWVPELREVSDNWIHQPWLMDSSLQQEANCIIGANYPQPIVDHATAVKLARQKLTAARQTAGYREESNSVFHKLGSRKRPNKPKAVKKDRAQMTLFG